MYKKKAMVRNWNNIIRKHIHVLVILLIAIIFISFVIHTSYSIANDINKKLKRFVISEELVNQNLQLDEYEDIFIFNTHQKFDVKGYKICYDKLKYNFCITNCKLPFNKFLFIKEDNNYNKKILPSEILKKVKSIAMCDEFSYDYSGDYGKKYKIICKYKFVAKFWFFFNKPNEYYFITSFIDKIYHKFVNVDVKVKEMGCFEVNFRGVYISKYVDNTEYILFFLDKSNNLAYLEKDKIMHKDYIITNELIMKALKFML